MRSAGGVWGLVLVLLVSLGGISLRGATQNALVTGLVLDQTGAPIAGATVRLINASIAFSQPQTTDTDGSYTFNEVFPAEGYVLVVEMEGFERGITSQFTVTVNDAKLVHPPILLNPRQAKAQPPTQPLGPAATARTHRTPALAPDLISTTLSGVIDSQTIRTLPLVGRDFIDLTLLVPGAYLVEQGSNLEGASLAVNGARANMNNFLLDGADNNDYTINQSLPFQIVEAMQEFRVQASTSTAEFGRGGGAQINTISRRGSNTAHGALFEFQRNSGSRANNFFSAYNGGTFDQYARFLRVANLLNPAQFPLSNPLADPILAAFYNQRNPRLIQNQFGGNAGGALVKDKLFGFFNYEGFRVSNPRSVFERVPGLPFRSSDAGFNPMTVALYNFYPVPNVPATAFTDQSAFAFFAGESANSTASDNFLERIDWQTGKRSSMSFKHNIQRIAQTQGGALPATPAYPGSGTQVSGRNQNFSYNYVQEFTPHAENEFRFGWNRFHLATSALDRSIDPATLGFRNLNFHDRGLPTLFVGGELAADDLGPFATLGAERNVPSSRANNVWSLADNLSLIRARHDWKLGIEFRHIALNTLDEGLGRGFLTFFSGPFAANFDRPDVASIARVSPEFGGGFDRYFRTQSLDWYVQDQWRPRSNFTLSYGVRYEVNTAPVELRNRLVNYYPDLGGLVRANDTTIFDPFGNVLGTAPKLAPRAGFETDKDNWGPHVGWAWDPANNGKTVLRGAYALVYDQQPLEPSVNMLQNPPFVHQDFSYFPNFRLGDTFGQNSASSTWYRPPYSTTARDPNTRTSYVHQFHFGIQQQLGGSALFEVAYVGSAGHKLLRLVDLRDCPLDKVLSSPSTCFDTSKPNPFMTSTILDQQTSANSIFHSLQARLDLRTFHGLQLRMHYQWAKSIDTGSSLQPQVFLVSPAIATLLVSTSSLNPENFAAANNISPTLSLRPTLPIITSRPRLPQDSNNLAGERGRSDFDITNRLVITYIYDFPRSTRTRFFGSGWQLAGITTIQSGQPFSVFDDFFGIPLRPDELSAPTINTSSPQATIDNANLVGTAASAFGLANNFQLKPGSLGRNTFTGPGLVNFDFSVLKSIYLGQGERKALQFRAEFFNLFNHANFFQPSSQAGLLFVDQFGDGLRHLRPDPFFGQTLQARPAREIQFAIKFVF